MTVSGVIFRACHVCTCPRGYLGSKGLGTCPGAKPRHQSRRVGAVVICRPEHFHSTTVDTHALFRYQILEHSALYNSLPNRYPYFATKTPTFRNPNPPRAHERPPHLRPYTPASDQHTTWRPQLQSASSKNTACSRTTRQKALPPAQSAKTTCLCGKR